MRRDTALMLLAALMLPAAAAYAKPMTFTANLTQALEVPPTGSPATGSATVTLDPAANTLRVQVTFSGLTSNTVMAHIHCCLPSLFQTGTNVGVATTVPAFPMFPLGVTSGTYDHVLDLTSAASYNPGFVTSAFNPSGTIAGAEAALIKGIVNGETYLNIHTTNFPGGEIRNFLVAAPAPAQLSLLTTIPINGTAGSPTTKMYSFDISWVDPANGLYYLADRSNKALDVVDTTGNFTGTADTLYGQIGGAAFGFAGDVQNPNGLSNTAISGPDGVVAGFPCIFAGDAGSRLISINGASSFVQPVSIVLTGGQFRVDEMAIDIKDGLVIAANNAEDVPFTSIYSYNKSTCVLSNQIKTFFNALPGGHTATNGIEQPVWEPMTQRFYVSLPEIDGPGDGTGINGGVARITTGGVVEAVYQINYCQPAGLTVGPNGDLLVGCNSVFDFSGKKCSSVVPAPSPSGTDLLGTPLPASVTPAHPALCTGIANPQAAICNPNRGCTPTNGSLVSVPGVGGGDEVWYNSGDGNYYVTAGNNPLGPTFGVVASVADALTQVVPTLPPVPTAVGVHGAGTVHSIAASAANNHVYVPLPANTDYPNCAQGCIAVFSAQ